MSFTLPDSTASGGLSHADTTVTQQKSNFTNLRGFLAELLGTSSASKTTPRSLLGIDGANITAAVNLSALTIALKTAAGADPAATSSLPIPFRHATLTNGAVAVRESVAATSLVISSGSTLGHTSAVAANIYVYALDTGSAVELAASSTFYGTSFIGSTTAEGGAGAADSATTIYSTTSRSNVAMRLLAVLVSTQATAGTWAAVPTDIRRADIAGVLDSLLTTKGDLLVKDANGRLSRLAVGSDGSVLTADSAQSLGLKYSAITTAMRGHIAGLTLSTAGSSATFTVSAGEAVDSTVAYNMQLASSLDKTTGSWAVGTGNGGLDGGSIATSTWYHAFLIRRPDTGVVDALVSLAPGKSAPVTMTIATPGVVTWTGHGLQANAPVVFSTTGALPTGVTAGTVYYVLSTSLANDTFRFSATRGGAAINTSGSQSGVHTCTSAPELPTDYTQYRRIGSMKTNGSSQWTKFVQDGDTFIWDAAVLDVNSTSVSATAAVTRALSVPPSFNVEAFGVVRADNSTAAASAYFIVTPLAITDVAPADTATPLSLLRLAVDVSRWRCRTDTSRQIRTRCGTAGTFDGLRMTTEGWVDKRGANE